jgi:hypothetical protein
MYKDKFVAAKLGDLADNSALFAAQKSLYCRKKGRVFAGICGVFGFLSLPFFALASKSCVVFCEPLPIFPNVVDALVGCFLLMPLAYAIGRVYAHIRTRALGPLSGDPLTCRIAAHIESPWQDRLSGIDISSIAWPLTALILLLPLLAVLGLTVALFGHEASRAFNRFFFFYMAAAIVPYLVAISYAVAFARRFPDEPSAKGEGATAAVLYGFRGAIGAFLVLAVAAPFVSGGKVTLSDLLPTLIIMPFFTGLGILFVGLVTLPFAFWLVAKIARPDYRLFSRPAIVDEKRFAALLGIVKQQLVSWRMWPIPRADG